MQIPEKERKALEARVVRGMVLALRQAGLVRPAQALEALEELDA